MSVPRTETQEAIMKKSVIILALLLVAALMFTFAGCGGGNSETEATTAATEATTAEETAAEAEDGGITADDVTFTYNGVKVELNGDAAAAIEALGEPESSESQLSCHGEGDDKTYTYDGFVLNTYPLDGEDRVLEIVIKSDAIETNKGVKVGDGAEAVKAAYGDSFKEVGLYYAYDAGDGKSLQFLIEDGVVSEIDYYYDV